MVGFSLRKKKSDKVMLGEDTILDRKGRVDGSSLLDDNGDPTEGTLYNQNRLPVKGARKPNDDENAPPAPPNYPAASYPYGQTYPPQQPGAGYPQHPQAQQQQFGGNRGSFGQPQYPHSYGQQPTQQYPQSYGYPPSEPYPPQPQQPKKSSFFRLPGMGKKK